LAYGDEGDIVRRLQSALAGYGYDLGPEALEGRFGENTRAAIAGFQEARGIAASGAADEATIAAMDLDPDSLEDLIEIDPSPGSSARSFASVATVDGDDIYLDPPIRLWPQYDARWAHARIAGPKTGNMLDWIANGCNACTAAMVLRWFAEDCTLGAIDFPTKADSTIDAGWYGLRMGEAFWPNADPPGKVELTPEGRIHFRKLYSVAAHYLKTGMVERNANGDAVNPSEAAAYYITQPPPEGWMSLMRTLLETGPVIVGIGSPAAHFVVAHGIRNGGLLIADPGAVLYQAHNGGKGEIENWAARSGYLDGTADGDRVRMPPATQWPGGQAPGQERDARSYHLISGDFLEQMLSRLISLTSLTYPEGAMLADE
jgi:hypothetical protein